jgi:hypothetical protein
METGACSAPWSALDALALVVILTAAALKGGHYGAELLMRVSDLLNLAQC